MAAPVLTGLVHRSKPGGESQSAEKGERLLNGCVPLSHQVAGHMYGKDKVGILQHPDGTVLKQLQPPPRGPRELNFYSMVFSLDCTNSHLLDLQKLLPKYFGTWSPPGSANDLYLKLEDITRKFTKPCIMDIKIGQKSYDPFASAEKIQQQVSKYPLMEEIGFLVLGMRVYNVLSDSYETQNQHYGRSLTKETVKEGVSKFFHNGTRLRKDAVAECVQKVQSILQWFELQENYHFYASSLLFVYEGSSPHTTKRLIDGTLVEKRAVPKGQFTDGECNNNIPMFSSVTNGGTEESVEKNMAEICALQRKPCSKRHHSQVSQEGESRDHGSTKSQNDLSHEHLNGNLVSKLENVRCHIPTDLKDGPQVDVRMIDFAHVFPSNGKDGGYIYGLKSLISVLQSILRD
ncbi:inositol polyphosphate multikinase L homeolog [Xenopus laevis]|uniref:Kinase n=1 Tax=Xenopus laevis TaxID=8355 RepID=Q66J00_XENLA|nr:inositol polyphosphate multikinase L homeolog [Xenopus laevis]AAH81124.1 MGC83832 protein [Xenopus laevis]